MPDRGQVLVDAVANDAPTLPVPQPTSVRGMKALNRFGIERRQILIAVDAKDPALLTGEERTPMPTIRARATDILNKIFANEPDCGLTARSSLRAITQINNGPILIETDSETTADWIRKQEHAAKFVTKLFTSGRIIKRTYPIILHFVPVAFKPDDDDHLRELEIQAGAPERSIVSASWIRKPEQRAPNQQHANLKVLCESAEAANIFILCPRLCVMQDQVVVKKEMKIPQVCNKCQKYGHFAAICTEMLDTCSKCGGKHRSNTCVADKSRSFCTPCNEGGHPTNDPNTNAERQPSWSETHQQCRKYTLLTRNGHGRTRNPHPSPACLPNRLAPPGTLR